MIEGADDVVHLPSDVNVDAAAAALWQSFHMRVGTGFAPCAGGSSPGMSSPAAPAVAAPAAAEVFGTSCDHLLEHVMSRCSSLKPG